jgi:hypothetical protein
VDDEEFETLAMVARHIWLMRNNVIFGGIFSHPSHMHTVRNVGGSIPLWISNKADASLQANNEGDNCPFKSGQRPQSFTRRLIEMQRWIRIEGT